MSKERYQRIRQYGGELDLTPGSESDVILVLERTEHYKKDPKNKILAQFELLPNYRFHRYVTGRSALEAAQGYGNGRVAAFVSAPGSAGTLAAGDEIKAQFPESVICALEPKECSTLFNNGRGTHRIEGIGDKMVTLIHNVLTTDYVALIHDDDCVMGLELLERRRRWWNGSWGCRKASWHACEGLFGISGICNILGAIRMARHLESRPRGQRGDHRHRRLRPLSFGAGRSRRSAAGRSTRASSMAGSRASSAAALRRTFWMCARAPRRNASSPTRKRSGPASAIRTRTWSR